MNDDPFAMTNDMMGSLGIDMSPWALAAGFVFSVVGFYFWREGKRRVNYGVLWTGVVLMIYPLFLSGALRIWLAGFALSAVGYYFWNRGEAA